MNGPGRDDGPNGVNGPGDPHGDDLSPLGFVVPDDIRELDEEVRAYRREQRRSRRRALVECVLQTRRWRRYGLSGPLVVVVLIVVAMVGSMLAFLGPRPVTRPVRLPMALTTAAPGASGGLLPDAQVTTLGAPVSVRELRPAVLALVPATCYCLGTLNELFRQAQQYRINLYLVGAPDQESALRRLSGRVGNGTAYVVLDSRRALADAYRADGLTTVLVHADGVVNQVHRDVRPGTRLDFEMAGLSGPGVRTPGTPGGAQTAPGVSPSARTVPDGATVDPGSLTPAPDGSGAVGGGTD